ncbi:hypothetical protein VP01_6462g1, partial [Puccinia sorghi]
MISDHQFNIRQILLREDMECYGRQTAQKIHSAKSSFALIKVMKAMKTTLAFLIRTGLTKGKALDP